MFRTKNENRLWSRLFKGTDINFTPQIPQKAMVQTNSVRQFFNKGYMPNWTKKNYTVSQFLPQTKGLKRRVYKLIDYND